MKPRSTRLGGFLAKAVFLAQPVFLAQGVVPRVRLHVEVEEQHEEEHSLEDGQVAEVRRETAVVEHRDGTVEHERDELAHLKLGQVALPPQVRPEPGAQGGERVVRVHDHVDEAVEEREERILSRGTEVDAQPDGPGDERVVDDVQSRYVAVLLCEHEEHSVHQFAQLEQHVPPAESDEQHRLRLLRQVDGFAEPRVVAEQVRQPAAVEEEEGVGGHMTRVVGEDDVPQVERLAVPHPCWSPHLDEVDVSNEDGDDRQRAAHERPLGHTRVCVGQYAVVGPAQLVEHRYSHGDAGGERLCTQGESIGGARGRRVRAQHTRQTQRTTTR
ncbi:hypothetical protein MRX96_002667 [Rhipicephalus microplus]